MSTSAAGHPATAGLIAFAARLLPPPRLFFETEAGIEAPPAGRGRRYWIVARGRCRFFKVSLLPAASHARQLAALGLEAQRLSPFAETGWHLHLGGDFAAIWVWDQAATRAVAAAAGIDIARSRVVPEPAMQPPGDDGLRLVQTLDGVEAQYWSGGALAASRWWPKAPDGRAWLTFQRGAALAPDEIDPVPPQPQHLGWLTRPWTTARAAGSFGLTRIDTRIAAAALGAVILLAYAYQGAQWLRVERDVALLRQEIARRSQQIEPLLEARSRALDNQSAIRLLRDLAPFPSQLALMARITATLPADGARLTAWVYDRGQLELGIASPRPLDVVKLVRALEGLDHFKSVAAERTGTGNSLRLHVALDPL